MLTLLYMNIAHPESIIRSFFLNEPKRRVCGQDVYNGAHLSRALDRKYRDICLTKI